MKIVTMGLEMYLLINIATILDENISNVAAISSCYNVLMSSPDQYYYTKFSACSIINIFKYCYNIVSILLQ